VTAQRDPLALRIHGGRIAVTETVRQYPHMRHEPALRLIRLALQLAGSRTGLTLDEIAQQAGVERRTAERLRNSLADLFPQLEFWDDDSRVRRWRLPGGALAGIAEPRPETVAAVEVAARQFAAHGETDRATLLREAAATLRALMRPGALARAEPDIEGLMQAEGIAMRPGPHPVIARDVLANIRRAILGMQLIVVRYTAGGANEPATRILCPYGILYGGRGWLVAHVENLPDMRLWRLDRIASVDLLDRSFTRSEHFSLSEYAAQSFGVFQEEAQDVVLRFTPDAAEDASSWMFHPTQTLEHENDGSLIVHLCCGGMRELAWHLFTWGDAVKVLEPTILKSMLQG